jgi:hypothetical protein
MSMNLMRYGFMWLLVCQCLLGSANDLFASISDTTRQEGYHKSIDLFYELSSVLHTNEFVKGTNPNNEVYHGFQAVSLKYSIHTDGRKAWEQLYAYPVWGVGLYQGFLMNDHGELGNPSAAYLFMDLPLYRWEKWSLNWEMGLGLSFNWKSHDPNENQYDYPISTSKTVFIDLGINAVVPLGKHVNLKAGLSTSHFSNGGFKVPNAGINVLGARAELQYLFKERPGFIYRDIPEYQREWEWIALIAPSRRQLGYEFVTPNSDTIVWTMNYRSLNFSSTLNRQISHKVKFGVGTDICYNEAYGADTIVVNSTLSKAPFERMDKILVGAYGSFELLLGKVSLIFQPGYYLYKKEVEERDIPSAYQRIGIKYHIGNNLIAGISIRGIYFSKAEFIEWTMGYRIKWSK